MKRLLATVLTFILFLASCSTTSQNWESRLKAIATQIAQAAGLAAAAAALDAAEVELSRLEAQPPAADPLQQLAQQTAIQAARELVTKARAKLAEERHSLK